MFNKIYKFIIKNKLNSLLVLSGIIYFLVALYDLKNKINNIDRYKPYIWLCILLFIIASIILFTIILLIIKKSKKNNFDKKIPKIFIITASILGIIYLFLSPLFSGSDEHNHYYRIYEISNGVMMTPTTDTVGSKMPKSLSNTFIEASGDNTNVKYKDIIRMTKEKLNKGEKIQYGYYWTIQYNNTALYSPIQYIPQVIGFEIGKVLNLGPFIIGMLGRLFNLITYIILGYLCLKIVPKSKLFYMLILLSPNMLQCASTLSADAFTNIIFLLFVALILKFSIQNEKITNKNKIALFILSIIISLCKIVYLPIVFLLLLIDYKKYGDKKSNKVLFCVITIAISIIISLLWIRTTNGVFDIAYNKSELQKQFILSNPMSYILIFIRTMSTYIINYIECLFVGTTMYHSQLEMPALISFSYVAIVILSLFKDNDNNKYNIFKRVMISLIAIIIIGLAVTAIYVQCTAQFYAVKNPLIEGVQGRYFIPVIMLIPLIINTKRIKFNSFNLYKTMLTINLITWFYMLSRFIA